MEKVNEEIVQEAMRKMDGKYPPEVLKAVERVLIDVHTKGKKFYEAMNIKKDWIEQQYAKAYTYYNSGKYQEAQNIFYRLQTYDPSDVRYVYGIAATWHMTKNYPAAIYNYMKTLRFPSPTPLVFFHLSDCFRHSGLKKECAQCLTLCIKKAADDPKYSFIKIRAQKELEQTLKEIEAEPAVAEKG